MRPLNLMPPDLIRRMQGRRKQRQWCIAGTVYAIAVAVGTVIALPTHSSTREIEAAIDATTSQSQHVALRITEAQAELKRISDEINLASRVSSGVPWSVLLKLLSTRLSEDMTLTRLTLVGPPRVEKNTPEQVYSLTIGGEAAHHQKVTAFVVSLEGLPVFDEVKLVKTVQSGDGDLVRVPFEIACRLRPVRRDGKGTP